MATEKDVQIRDFARRLQKEMLDRGWSQSDLARQAQKHMPEGKEFGRHLINYYLRLRGLPSPIYLKALAEAFQMKPEELIPQVEHWTTREFTGVQMKSVDGSPDEVWLQINQRMPLEAAVQIMQIMKGVT